MKTKYTKKQISEAIKYWTKQLKKMNESVSGSYAVLFQNAGGVGGTGPNGEQEEYGMATIADALNGHAHAIINLNIDDFPEDDAIDSCVADNIEDIDYFVSFSAFGHANQSNTPNLAKSALAKFSATYPADCNKLTNVSNMKLSDFNLGTSDYYSLFVFDGGALAYEVTDYPKFNQFVTKMVGSSRSIN